MQHAAAVGVVECVGKPAAQPGHRLRPGQGGEVGAGARFGGPDAAAVEEFGVDGREQQPTVPQRRIGVADPVQHAAQCPTGDILHVHQLHGVGGIHRALGDSALVEHPHDVVVIEMRERLRFRAVVGGDLYRDEALHRPLPGQVHPGERAGAEVGEQVEVVDAGPDTDLVEGGRRRPRRGHRGGGECGVHDMESPRSRRTLTGGGTRPPSRALSQEC